MLIRFINLLIVGWLMAGVATAQAPDLSTSSPCRLSGADTVRGGSTASFTLGPCTAINWTVSSGTIVAQSAGSVTVRFPGSSGATATITAVANVGGQAVSKSVIIRTTPALAGGTVATASQAQSVTTGKIPSPILADAATGGTGDGVFTYQWLASTDGIVFTPIAGAVAQNYQPGPLKTTTWFKRRASNPTGDSVTAGPVLVTVYPSVTGIPILPPLQALNHHGTPAPLTLTVPAVAPSVTYQWQRAYNASFSDAVNLSGASSTSYAPGNMDTTCYYRVMVLNNRDTLYSSPAVVAVHPSLNPGGLQPATQTLTSADVSALLTSTGISGGDGNYLFQWYSSPDGISWSPVLGVASQSYSPGSLKATTWFRVLVSSNGVSLAGTSALITVNP